MIKKTLLVACSALLLVACSKGPEDSAKKFSENLSKGKVEEAKKYATESTGKILDFGSSFRGLPVDPNFKFNFIKDSIVENKAWVDFADQEGNEKTLTLFKIDGKWLVHMESKK